MSNTGIWRLLHHGARLSAVPAWPIHNPSPQAACQMDLRGAIRACTLPARLPDLPGTNHACTCDQATKRLKNDTCLLEHSPRSISPPDQTKRAKASFQRDFRARNTWQCSAAEHQACIERICPAGILRLRLCRTEAFVRLQFQWPRCSAADPATPLENATANGRRDAPVTPTDDKVDTTTCRLSPARLRPRRRLGTVTSFAIALRCGPAWQPDNCRRHRA